MGEVVSQILGDGRRGYGVVGGAGWRKSELTSRPVWHRELIPGHKLRYNKKKTFKNNLPLLFLLHQLMR